MIAIFKRELRGYFQTPIGYAFMGFFLLVAGIFFLLSNLQSGSGSFAMTLAQMSFVFMVLVPALTMRLMAEERRNKTDQMLLTAPVGVTAVVFAKFLAAVTLFAATLAVTLVYPIILARYGTLPVAEIFGGYLGFFLLGASLIAVGLCMSSLFENQVTAAASTFAVLLGMFQMDALLPSIPWAPAASVLSWLSVFRRFDSFSVGYLQLSAVVYYLSFATVFVFLCVRVVERRRWAGG